MKENKNRYSAYHLKCDLGQFLKVVDWQVHPRTPRNGRNLDTLVAVEVGNESAELSTLSDGDLGVKQITLQEESEVQLVAKEKVAA